MIFMSLKCLEQVKYQDKLWKLSTDKQTAGGRGLLSRSFSLSRFLWNKTYCITFFFPLLEFYFIITDNNQWSPLTLKQLPLNSFGGFYSQTSQSHQRKHESGNFACTFDIQSFHSHGHSVEPVLSEMCAAPALLSGFSLWVAAVIALIWLKFL